MYRLKVSIGGGQREVYLPRGKEQAIADLLKKVARQYDRSPAWAARYLTALFLGVERVSELDKTLVHEARRRRTTPTRIMQVALIQALEGAGDAR